MIKKSLLFTWYLCLTKPMYVVFVIFMLVGLMKELQQHKNFKEMKTFYITNSIVSKLEKKDVPYANLPLKQNIVVFGPTFFAPYYADFYVDNFIMNYIQNKTKYNSTENYLFK